MRVSNLKSPFHFDRKAPPEQTAPPKPHFSFSSSSSVTQKLQQNDFLAEPLVQKDVEIASGPSQFSGRAKHRTLSTAGQLWILRTCSLSLVTGNAAYHQSYIVRQSFLNFTVVDTLVPVRRKKDRTPHPGLLSESHLGWGLFRSSDPPRGSSSVCGRHKEESFARGFMAGDPPGACIGRVH